jgi:murein DD-endopeptidase MepM/ murein hydrolase activator NlpD
MPEPKSVRTAVTGHAILFVILLFINQWSIPGRNLFDLIFHPSRVTNNPTLIDSHHAAFRPAAPAVAFEHTIRYGQTLAELLGQSLVQRSDIALAIAAFQKIFDPRNLRTGQALRVTVDSAGALQQIFYRPSPEITLTVQREANGELSSRCDTLKLVPVIFLLSGEVETTLYDAVKSKGETPELLLAFTDIFQWDIDFFIDPQSGDRFRILFEKLFVQKPEGRKEFVRYGRILSATYEPVRPQRSNLSKEILAAFYFDTGTGKGGYFDQEGKSFQKTFLKSPLNYRRVSSYFSFSRRHPLLKKVRAHTGVDFAAPTGTPVVAAADGTIKSCGWNGGYGNCVVIEHKNHFTTLYGHLSRFAEGLKEEEMVQQGQVIGFVGSTGMATGSHLHYTMYLNGTAINPLRIQPASGDPIPEALSSRFATQRDSLLVQMGLLPAEFYGPPLLVGIYSQISDVISSDEDLQQP